VALTWDKTKILAELGASEDKALKK
jgi:hypothetical protein